MPAVSVIIAACNQERWLGEAIESVREQTFEDWELIVIDDGSTDDTRAVARRFTEDPRIRYVFETNRERAAARNRGLELASTGLVAFLDADDRWRPEKLCKQVAALEAEPAAGFCYTVARVIDEAGQPCDERKPLQALSGWLFPRLLRGNFIILASVLARRTCLDAVGGFDATLLVYGCEDWDLWLRLARRYPVTVVDEELTLYRRHPANTAWRQVMASGLRVIDKVYADPEVVREASISRAAVRSRHCWYHVERAVQEHRMAGLQLAGRAFRECPSAALSRPAIGAVARLVLPGRVVGALMRVPRWWQGSIAK